MELVGERIEPGTEDGDLGDPVPDRLALGGFEIQWVTAGPVRATKVQPSPIPPRPRRYGPA